MNRSARTFKPSRRLLGLATLIACLAAMAGLVVMPRHAEAQDSGSAAGTLVVSEDFNDGQPRTAAFAFDPQQDRVAALQGRFVYDAAELAVIGCSVSEVGACNDVGGEVRFSLFNLAGVAANNQLVTIDFVPAHSEAGVATLAVELEVVANGAGTDLGEMIVSPIEVVLPGADADLARGSLTGDVIDVANQEGLFGIDVCVTEIAFEVSTCATTTGLGTWRIDDLREGEYVVVVSDPNGVYADGTVAGSVVSGEITAGIDTALDYFVEETEDTTDDDAVPQVTPSIVREYGATIEGVVRDASTGAGAWAIQVCATQPLVLHQSCATTNEGGEFVLEGVSTGNYWITVVDPLGERAALNDELVGVYDDFSTRSGVDIWLGAAG